jgi:hypothetical protein
MTLDAKDLKRLQWAIAFLLIMSAVGGGAVWTTEQMKNNSSRALQEATAARKDIQAKLARARDEQQELTEKLNRFQVLKDPRPDRTGKAPGLDRGHRPDQGCAPHFKLEYEFAPQRLVDASILPGGGRRAPSNSCRARCACRSNCCMKANCWTSLPTSAPICARRLKRWCMVRSCAIERLESSAADRGSKAQLKAECTLEWITLKEGK